MDTESNSFTGLFWDLKEKMRPGVLAQACNLSTLEAKAGGHLRLVVQDQPDKHGEILSLKKNEFSNLFIWITNLGYFITSTLILIHRNECIDMRWGQARWHMPVVPLTQEAMVENLLSPDQQFQAGMGDIVRLSFT